MKTKKIKLAVIENDLDINQQIEKIIEEYHEFLDEVDAISFNENSKNRDAAVAEGLDLIQATYTMLNKLGLSEEDIKKHLHKLDGYKKIDRI